MHRTFKIATALAAIAALALTMPAVGQEKGKAKEEAAEKSTAERLRDNPDDSKALVEHLNKAFGEIQALVQKDPKGAAKKLDELEAFLDSQTSSSAQVKQVVGQGTNAVKFLREAVEIAQVPLADLEKAVTSNPDDTEALNRYVRKVSGEIQSLARSEPEKAEKQLTAAKDLLAKTEEAAKDESAKKTLTSTMRNLDRLQSFIDSQKKLLALVGKDAAPLAVKDWVNGEPLTDEDLKNKVVLLDFWAIWCGPCIATFPHLREWNEKYAGKGLVIIGVTEYYKFEWDADAERAVRAKGEITEAEEQEMLAKFAEHHGLKHRFAVAADDSMSKYYGVSGIPHVVVIDQQGKVRMVRVGSGEQNASDIGGLLEKLLGPVAGE